MRAPKVPEEPRRIHNITDLVWYMQDRIGRVFERMRKRGYDPIAYETERTEARQAFLYGQGRTKAQLRRAGVNPIWAKPGLPIRTYTMDSKHMHKKAVDVISVSRLWGDPKFFDALEEEAKKEGFHTLGFERCHVEWRG